MLSVVSVNMWLKKYFIFYCSITFFTDDNPTYDMGSLFFRKTTKKNRSEHKMLIVTILLLAPCFETER